MRELARRPGAQSTFVATVPAPEVFGTDVIGVPEGNDLELDLSFESISDGIWVSGTVVCTAIGECIRCLDEVSMRVEAPVKTLYVYATAAGYDDEDAEDVREFDGESIDVEQALRDAVVPMLPFQPVCDPDCPGLCDQCGAPLKEDPGHKHEAVDPRWAALRSLTDGSDLTEQKES